MNEYFKTIVRNKRKEGYSRQDAIEYAKEKIEGLKW